MLMELATHIYLPQIILLMSVLRVEIFGTSGYLCYYKGNFLKIRQIENISITSLMKQYKTVFSTLNS